MGYWSILYSGLKQTKVIKINGVQTTGAKDGVVTVGHNEQLGKKMEMERRLKRD